MNLFQIERTQSRDRNSGICVKHLLFNYIFNIWSSQLKLNSIVFPILIDLLSVTYVGLNLCLSTLKKRWLYHNLQNILIVILKCFLLLDFSNKIVVFSKYALFTLNEILFRHFLPAISKHAAWRRIYLLL